MRRLGMIGLAAAAAVIPAFATVAQTPRTWGNVPDVALQTPPGAGAAGWGPGGWQGGPPPAPVAGSPAHGAPVPPPHPGGPGMAMARPVGAGGMGGPGPVAVHRGPPGGSAMGYTHGSRRGMNHGGGGAAGYRGGGLYSVRRGDRLPGTFLAPTYYITNWSSYGLAGPGHGYNWVRYYNGAALIDSDGTVQDYRDSVNWGGGGLAGPGFGGPGFGGPGRGGPGFGGARRTGGPGAGPGDRAYAEGYDDGFDDGVDYAEDAVTYRGQWQHGAVRLPSGHPPVFQHPAVPGYGGGHYGPDGDGRAYGGYGYQNGYAAGGAQVYSSGGATVVVVQGAPAVTTTTTVEETVSYVAGRKRVWHKPVRTWRPRPRCSCTWK